MNKLPALILQHKKNQSDCFTSIECLLNVCRKYFEHYRNYLDFVISIHVFCKNQLCLLELYCIFY